MKRPLLAVLLLLLLGLCSSLLVAWAGALVDRQGWPDTPLTGAPIGTRTEMRGWLVEAGRDRTLTWRTFTALDLWDEPPDLEAPTTLPGWSVGRTLADQPGPFAPARERTRDVAWEVSAGWPLRCVRAVRTAGPAEFALPGEFVRGGLPAMAYGWPTPHGAVAGHEGIEISPWPIDGLAATIPLRPMVGGLLANTLVHALAWCVLLLPLCLPGPLRRRRRARKNRCAHCGHARDGLPNGAPCAECGRDPNARTPVGALLIARPPMLGTALALILVLSASVALLTHRWMAVDRLPPLHHAAAVGDVERIERLIAGGADVEDQAGPFAGSGQSSDFATALMWAAARGQRDAIGALLGRGALPDGLWHAESPMDLAIHSGDAGSAHAILDALVGRPAVLIDDRMLALCDDSMRRRFIEMETWNERRYYIACIAAMEACDVGLYAVLHEALADRFDVWPERAFEHAIEIDARAAAAPWGRESDLTSRFLAVGLPVRRDDRDHALQRVLRHGPASAALALLDAGGRPDSAALCDAAFLGDPSLVRRLLDMGLDPNGDPGVGGPPMAYALARPSPDAAAVLLDAGASPFSAIGGVAYRTLLLDALDEHGDFRQFSNGGTNEARVRAIARMCDLLEAAEAEWTARATPDPTPPTPGGP